MLSSLEMDSVTGVQALNEDVCIYQSANTLSRRMNPTIFSPSMDKYYKKLGSLTLYGIRYEK